MSDPTDYSDIKIVTSVVISSHKAIAIIAFNGPAPVSRGKSSIKCRYRKKSPNQNALFLQHLSTVEDLEIAGADSKEQFDSFYGLALLDRLYPEKTISITLNDPDFITPELKASLRRKNNLTRTGRVEETNGIARLIGKKISRWNSVQLKNISSKTDQKEMWKKVKQFFNRRCTRMTRSNLTATQLDEEDRVLEGWEHINCSGGAGGAGGEACE